MQTKIHERFSGLSQVVEAEQILRTCVHCGFCNATCPTYLELGDERDDTSADDPRPTPPMGTPRVE